MTTTGQLVVYAGGGLTPAACAEIRATGCTGVAIMLNEPPSTVGGRYSKATHVDPGTRAALDAGLSVQWVSWIYDSGDGRARVYIDAMLADFGRAAALGVSSLSVDAEGEWLDGDGAEDATATYLAERWRALRIGLPLWVSSFPAAFKRPSKLSRLLELATATGGGAIPQAYSLAPESARFAWRSAPSAAPDVMAAQSVRDARAAGAGRVAVAVAGWGEPLPGYDARGMLRAARQSAAFVGVGDIYVWWWPALRGSGGAAAARRAELASWRATGKSAGGGGGWGRKLVVVAVLGLVVEGVRRWIL